MKQKWECLGEAEEQACHGEYGCIFKARSVKVALFRAYCLRRKAPSPLPSGNLDRPNVLCFHEVQVTPSLRSLLGKTMTLRDSNAQGSIPLLSLLLG